MRINLGADFSCSETCECGNLTFVGALAPNPRTVALGMMVVTFDVYFGELFDGLE